METDLTRTRPLALVTGASAGLGAELARALARSDYDLVLAARRQNRLDALADELSRAHGVSTQVVPVDLSSAEGPDQLFNAVLASRRTVSLLANNAGLGQWGPYLTLDSGRETEQMMVNVVALTRLCRLFLPGMVEKGSGRVLNVASTAAFFPGPLMSVYYASKAYVLSYSVALAEELKGTGVTATCLCSGPIETEFSSLADQNHSKLFQNSVITDVRTMAEAGVEATLRGAVICTPGTMNKLSAVGSRLFPRAFLARAVKHIQGPKALAPER